MSNITTPSTELEAVNIILSTIGEGPVSSLNDTQIVDAVLARSILIEVTRAVLSQGWHFNSEEHYPLTPDIDGHILLPLNAVQFDLDKSRHPAMDVAQRGRQLYNKINHTYKFTEEVLYCRIIFLFPLESIPEHARRYCTIRAARVFQKRFLGSETLDGFTYDEELRAKIAFLGAEAENDDLNMLTDTNDVARILRR